MSISADPCILAAVRGGLGTITLNRPAALNALTLSMIRAIREALGTFERDPAVRVIVIESAREGCFCAGGDIRSVRASRLAERHAEADAFFAEEFALDLAIADCAKPYVALIDGVCMGGGVGLAVHGAHRVVSETLVMAMPETAIGYVPDVGASFFLNAAPGRTGLYIGLTGQRLAAADALYCGLATACVPMDRWPALRAGLTRRSPQEAAEAIAQLSVAPPAGVIERNRAVIDRCFDADRVEDIFACLQADGGDFAQAALAAMQAASPASLTMTFDLLRGARGRSLEDCLERELALAKAVTRSADFAEGVRALLVDKDRRPQWSKLSPPV